MNKFLTLPSESDHLFVHVPTALNRNHLEEVMSRHLGEAIRIQKFSVENVCAGMFGGVACSGATILCLHLDLSNGKSIDVAAKILSPDPVNLFKIDCRYDSRVAEIRWTDWWGKRSKSWTPIVYDTNFNSSQREFWILREFYPRIGWQDVPVSEQGHFRLDEGRLRLMMETVAELHAESFLAIEELRQLFPEPGIGQGRECRLLDLETALDGVIADEDLFSTVGIGDQERDRIKTYRDTLAKRPSWLEDWRIVCVTADLKPDNFGFRSNDVDNPVMFDFGACRLAPMEEELTLLLDRLHADEALTESVLTCYLDRFAEYTGETIAVRDFQRRLPWALPLLLLRSLIEQADALRWVPWQDRSKGYIRYFIEAVGKQLNQSRFA